MQKIELGEVHTGITMVEGNGRALKVTEVAGDGQSIRGYWLDDPTWITRIDNDQFGWTTWHRAA